MGQTGHVSADWGSGTIGKIRPHGDGKTKRKPLIFEVHGLFCSSMFLTRERLKELFGTRMRGQFCIFRVGLDLTPRHKRMLPSSGNNNHNDDDNDNDNDYWIWSLLG